MYIYQHVGMTVLPHMVYTLPHTVVPGSAVNLCLVRGHAAMYMCLCNAVVAFTKNSHLICEYKKN